MKKSNFLSKIQVAVLALVTNFAVVMANAQEKAADLNVDVNVDKGGSAGWISNPIVWIAGVIILVLIVALAARGGGSKA
ncbi:hypothetical protein ASG01_10990 [Chryseobacterium sp. Leaf180]|uniref:hypothetical protein n=1 Tax=Chryseobacterium sp. Leaf180 TaxID=1736289 RepID=UPI0006F8EDA1|nr:hypothetical protein [Chryseobacterium sp. Leaf180]KQR92440.1 hypothetical protein ASG01_10990 [Chryseobacterium sp. Leaf180]